MKKTITLFILLLTSIFVKAQTTQDYIAEHVDYAQKLMRIYQVPASIILGVAIHESAAGKSKIARYLNNHFGVKGPNNSNEIRSAYRDYPTVDSSYNHFVSFLRDRTYYNVLFTKYDQYDYKNWARGIQRGGYASSRTWASQVIALIKKYELYKYDDRPDDYMETVIPATNIVAKSTRSSRTKSRSSIAKKSKSYTIKSGENLNQIAERNGTTSTALMRKNGLKSAVVQPGQKIKL
ncbi:LysM peptidoglycan-binding domain-containing protein [Pedobacter sp. LMG 31464]|uniref:Peptidoglycan hydrolase n=1 Tax=Pedobacter planticolens TaxID=2679964 RepID=A0A923E2M1_9SPHI|nr:glucosaminidase domain-containing protein [Pedobacter planticolens]MBB2146332.1 LysM peptidoglycan-binding domain-containing protein [Pedobacter planticolens]